MKLYNYIINEKNIVFRLGTNAKENHLLIDNADSNDWWFHLDSFPSGHCIVESSELSNEIINYASNIVNENSKYKNHKKIGVKYLQIKNIRKTKNPGEVKLLTKGKIFFI